MRIKCPNCQNVMTITLLGEDTNKYGTTHTREYGCKCGCVFEVEFVAKISTILEKPIDKPQMM